jgi:hypothetical protein
VTADEQAEAGIPQDHNVIDGMVSEMAAPGDPLPAAGDAPPAPAADPSDAGFGDLADQPA